MIKHLLKTLVAVLAIATAATGPARAQGTVQLTLASNNSAMGYATVALHPEYELYDTYTTSSSQNGTKTSMWTTASVTDGAWINTTESNSTFSVNPNYGITFHHVTFYNANNQSVEVEPNDGNGVYVQLQNGNVYRDYECTQLLLSGGITRVEAYGMEMSLPAGVTATATAGVYDVVPGTQVPVAAVAKRHYQLNNWSNNATTDTVTVTVNAAMTLTANFTASPVLTLVANNAQMGRVEIPRHQGNGFLCEFKAADYAGQQPLYDMHEKFYFNTPSVAANSTVWTNNEGYTYIMSVNPEGFGHERNQCRVVFVGPNGETYECDFKSNHMAEIFLKSGNTYSDYDCNNLLWQGGVASIECYGPGLILPDGVDQITDNTYSVLAGTEVPVEATAKLRYHFVNWSNNSTAAQTTFTMPATAATLTATFAANPTLTLTATPAHGGSVGFDFTPTPQTLTVNDGTATNAPVPIYLCNLDNAGTRGQHIIPAEQLGLMAGGTLNSITWYVSDEYSWSSTSNVNVYLKEVDNTTLTEYVNSETATLVYTGTLSYADGQMTVTFSEPYTYQGGNLLVGVDNTAAGEFTCRDFLGVDAPAGSSAGGSNGYYEAQSFLPKSTFNYTPALPAGVIANTDGTYSVAAGTQFTLKANAADDYTLGSWSNQAEVNANATQTLTMPAANLTIGATFVGQPHTVRFAAGNDGWSVQDVTASASATAPAVLQNVMAGDSLVVTAPATLPGKVKSVKAVKYVPPVLVQSIVLDKQTASLGKDSTMTLSVASVLPENAADKSYSWSSDDIAVADVDQDGVVIGHNAGTANIIATANDGSGAKDTCVVTVLSPVILDGVTLLYASEDDRWSTVVGYNPGLIYLDSYKVRLTSNDAVLYYDGYPVNVIDFIYPSAKNDYQWLRVIEIGGGQFYYHQGETWQQAINAGRPDNNDWSIDGGQVKFMGNMTLIDTDSEPVDPSATIDPTVDYGYIM